MDISAFEKMPLMGIVRGINIDDIEPLIEVSAAGGLETIEITMNTREAADIISKAAGISRGRMSVGAGTVLSMDDMKTAIDAGAEFIVMPVMLQEVMDACLKENIPVFPGAFTPQEVFKASESGASMVKVFPSSAFGPSYIKQLKGPFDKIKIMAVGGVKLDNIKEYFEAGAGAVAFGSSVFKDELIRKKDFSSIGDTVAQYVQEVRSSLRNQS